MVWSLFGGLTRKGSISPYAKVPVSTTKSSFRAGLQIHVHCVAGTGRRSPLFRFLCLLNIRLNLLPLSPIRQQWISRRSRLVHLSPIRQQWISRRSRLVHLSPIRRQCINITALARFTPFRWIDQKRVNLTLHQGALSTTKSSVHAGLQTEHIPLTAGLLYFASYACSTVG